MTPHLWDADHPYYCAPGNFYKGGCVTHWASWRDFIGEHGDGDRDLNLVWRWDWDRGAGALTIHVMAQRKAMPWTHEIDVTPQDEPAVATFLAECWETIRAMWAPFEAHAADVEAYKREWRAQRVAQLRAELALLEGDGP